MHGERADTFGRHFRQGRYQKAAQAVLSRGKHEPKPPFELYEVFFPSDDGRQDLVNWLTIRKNMLAPHLGTYRRLRASLAKTLGLKAREGEGAALLAYCDLFLGDYERAVVEMERAAKSAPSSFGLHFLRAVALWLKAAKDRSRDRMPDALTEVNAALAHDDRNVYAYYVRVGLRRELEDVAGRLADARTMIKLRPDFVWASVEIAETLGETNHYREALREFNRLIKRYPDQAWGWAQRGRLRGIYGYSRLALEDFAEAVRLDPACGPVFAWRGEAWRRAGDYARAFADFDAAIRVDPSYRLANQWRGRLHLILGRYPKAIADFDQVLRLEPREQLAAAWRAEALWKLGRAREAAEGFDALHPAEPKNAWNRVVGESELHEVVYQMRAGQTPERREKAFWDDLDRIVASRPDDAWAWAFRGRCKVSAGRAREALVDLGRALQLGDGLSYAHRWRGECLRRMGATERAVADFDRALELEAKDRWSSAYRALARATLGDAAGAESDYRRALAPRDQRFSVVHLWQAQWLDSLGRTEEARVAIEAAFILDGKDPRVLEWRARLGRPRAAARLR